jgi:alkanesulfonate monooxygenase SsuD/methylene tetrahydromethanopterin reductase-like flavin-dependent oxidoreductase (luciferase family)
MLTFVAGVTERVGLGTAALILPLRHPVLLAKEIATLDFLMQGRFILGIATGWDPKEFEVLDVPLRQRGRRTDEALDLLKRLLSEDAVTFKGSFWQVDDVTIYPKVAPAPPLWVAGGSLGHAPETPDKPYIAPGVLRRILRAEGWMTRSSGSDADMVKADWEVVQEFLRAEGRDPKTLTLRTPSSFTSSTRRLETMHSMSRCLISYALGTNRTREDLASFYLLGTVDEIQGRIDDLRAVGLEHMILTPVSNDPRQLDLINKHVVGPFNN